MERDSGAGNFTGGRRPIRDWSRGFPTVFHRSPKALRNLLGHREELTESGEDQASFPLFLIQSMFFYLMHRFGASMQEKRGKERVLLEERSPQGQTLWKP